MAIVETWVLLTQQSCYLIPLIARGESLLSKNSIPPGNDEFYRWGADSRQDSSYG